MKICRQLSSGEIIVLSAVYKIYKEKRYEPTRESVNWLNNIAIESRLEHAELVELHERELIRKNLISDRLIGDRTLVRNDSNRRLTPLAFNVIKFIKNYDKDNETKK
jgi:hypothetical protein